MKIIDVDLHIGQWLHNSAVQSSLATLQKAIRRHGIEYGLATPLESILAEDNLEVNYRFFKEIEGYSLQIMPMLALNPQQPGLEKAMERYIDQAAGIKLFHRFQRYNLSDSLLEIIYETAQSTQQPIVIPLHLFEERIAVHYFDYLEEVKVEDLLQTADAWPAVNFVFSAPLPYEAIELLAAGRKNIFVTTSFLEGEGLLEEIIDKYGVQKILYGSNYPFFYMEASLRKLCSQSFSRHMMEHIYFNNANNIFRSDR
jgi:predicted TIM-barrel fold metal-dependent hydrolase